MPATATPPPTKMITMAAIATLAAVLNPFAGAGAPWGAGEGVAGAADVAGAFDEPAGVAEVFGIGAPVVGVPHLPQNRTVSSRLDPQFLQNVLMIVSVVFES